MIVGEIRSTVQSTAQSRTLWSGRPPGRPPRYREQSSLVRSTGPLCLPNVHKAVHVGQPHGRPNHGPVDRNGRPTCTALCTSGRHRTGRPAGRPDQRALLSVSGRSTGSVDRSREVCSLYLGGRPCGRPDAPTVIFLTVGGQPGRSTASLSGCQISLTASFLFGLYKPHFFGILAKIF